MVKRGTETSFHLFIPSSDEDAKPIAVPLTPFFDTLAFIRQIFSSSAKGLLSPLFDSCKSSDCFFSLPMLEITHHLNLQVSGIKITIVTNGVKIILLAVTSAWDMSYS